MWCIIRNGFFYLNELSLQITLYLILSHVFIYRKLSRMSHSVLRYFLIEMNVLVLRFVTILCIWWKALAMSMELTLRIWVTFKSFLFRFHYSLICINTLFCILCLMKKNMLLVYIFFYVASKRAPHVCKTVYSTVPCVMKDVLESCGIDVTFLTLALDAV